VIYSTHDTDWATSAQGNHWRRTSGLVLVAGRAKNGTHFWGMIDGEFIDGYFDTLADAMEACEDRANLIIGARST
jgi:hypothetical protein